MGDLDDFFAKKDKKKKGGKKFSKANTDVLAKNLQESERREQKEQEKQDKDLGIAQIPEDKVSAILAPQDDEEWDDYRENKKDYSGLKIESLKIEEPQEEEEEETEINEDGEVVSKKKDESGPWNKLAAAGIQQHEQEKVDHYHHEVDVQTPNVVGGSYVPPHMRGSAAAASPAADQRRPMPRGKAKAAPDISSEVYFPSLSASLEDAGPKGGAWGKGVAAGGAGRRYDDGGHFEEVKESGGKSSHMRHAEAPKLALGNKFDALREGD